MKKVKKSLMLMLISSLLIACQPTEHLANYEVIPLPNEILLQDDVPAFQLKRAVAIQYPEGNELMERNARFLSEYLLAATGVKAVLTTTSQDKGIVLEVAADVPEEGYRLLVNADQITISGSSEAGVFYGIQTLRKSLPLHAKGTVLLPAVEINDFPRFGYRGMMLDVSRHFFTVEEVKTYIDILALHKVNRLHWHLTDDQGWRVEIKKYPKLTEIGSHRKETVIGRNTSEYDGIPHGGFYTQDELRDVVAYAAERYITVMPEIDLPGHMMGALAAYPHLGCTGGPYEVWTQWGISEEVLCVGNDETLTFIEDVLTEIVDIFPSEYIHIGGDECPKTSWRKCEKCQTRIVQLGLKADEHHSAEDRLQSYVITFAEEVLNRNGRKMVGWDEILEGGLAPNATVMSWRGMGGGIEAARLGHDVIMTPNSHLYFDHYQSRDVENEPLAIGGYSPLERVYSLNPVPDVLTAEQQKHILGVQANIWTEYMPVFSHVQYMLLPRLAALAEIQWMQNDKRDYNAFLGRIMPMINRYEKMGYNYGKHLFDITAELVPNTQAGTLDVTLSTIDGAPIYYTLDGTEPTKRSKAYTETLLLTEDAEFRAVVIRGKERSRTISETISLSKASLKPITAIQPVNGQYRYKGISTLVDGLRGGSNYRTGRWIAFYGNDLEAVIDLEVPTEISFAQLTCNVVNGDWIFDARSFFVEVSDDGENFTRVAGDEYPAAAEQMPSGIYAHQLTFESVVTRYVKVFAASERSIPEWHGGKGRNGFLFVDEIVLK